MRMERGEAQANLPRMPHVITPGNLSLAALRLWRGSTQPLSLDPAAAAAVARAAGVVERVLAKGDAVYG
jgi:histidine ammonia-lyase